MAGQQIDVYIASGITWAVAFIALILRMVARRITKLTWWYDDYICLAAFAAASGYNILMLYWAAHYFLGEVIPPSYTEEQREEVNRKSRLLMLCCEYCYATSIACTKFTILVFYWRLFKSSSIRLAIQIMFGISVAWILLRTFMVSFQCIPIQYFWDKSIKGHCSINEAQFFFGTILTHCIMDIIIFALPIFEVSKLRLRLGQKLGVIGLFLIGFIVCLASVITIIESVKYPSKTNEMPRDSAPSFIWGNVEMNIAIVSACVPLLRPVFRVILPHSFLSSYGSSHPISGHPISRTNASRTHPSNAIKLSTLTKSKEVDAFETSSTHKLADPEEGLRTHSDLDQRPDVFRTVITSNSSGSFSSDEDNNVGIYMRNDITVQVEEARKSYMMRR